jgi:hypothetical protein
VDCYSKEEVVEALKHFREYLKIEKILEGKLKKSKIDIYNRKLNEFEENYNVIIKKEINFFNYLFPNILW